MSLRIVDVMRIAPLLAFAFAVAFALTVVVVVVMVVLVIMVVVLGIGGRAFAFIFACFCFAFLGVTVAPALLPVLLLPCAVFLITRDLPIITAPPGIYAPGFAIPVIGSMASHDTLRRDN